MENYIKKSTHIFIDPPYVKVKNLYKGDLSKEMHENLANMLSNYRNSNKRILITYDDSELVRQLYKDWNIKEVEYQYNAGLKTDKTIKKKINELFITNY